MSVFHEFLKNTQKEKSSSQTETEINNIVIPSFFVISVEILIGFMFGEAFGLWFVIGGVTGLVIWSITGEKGREDFGNFRKRVTFAFAEFVREEQRKQEKRERGKRIYRRFNQTRRHEASEVPHMTDFLRPILQWASRKSGVFHDLPPVI